ncbi:hypothetical protein [Gloeothece verrucosa]|uniref:Uncharacterized protein n=1 Tax=Gloeothece verrucosa (strain PCC 7822) TaxID=497965 RepID=E0UBX8_GLOV7|nr:hypothetical protein [Gloeothece verrucosa]ADN15193.1 conserved hypothetical protein [Gloeothece verrucosa PCC 7822]
MKPKFKDTRAWEQAQLLMQPAFIRVMDNLRKQLEESSWSGTYQEIQTPFPGYQLCLTHQHHSVTVNIWDLCFKICFIDYPISSSTEASIDNSQEVDIDPALIDETGDVDWHRLETKTQYLVKEVFANLPT